ncbi:MAG TPA: HAMP domain-containing protein, partial [Clostridia bacterium]
MSIRLKLILSNIAMSLIPFFAAIILAIAILISLVHGSNIQKFQSQGSLEKAVLDKYHALAGELIINPQRIKDPAFLGEAEKSLKKFDAALVVVYQDKVYFSDERIDEKEFLKSFLSSKFHKERKVQVSTYIEILNNDIILPGNEKYTLYILINWKPIIDFCLSFLGRFSIGLILIIIVTNGFLTFLISKGIISPLNKLKSGVENIKNGNLNFSTDDESKNEFGDVLRAFEEMRQRLKDSIEKQMTYDENRNEFLESITHDLKTPITSIKGYIEGLKDGV